MIERPGEPALDWTQGAEAILYEACPDCGHRTYLRRGFCPVCGSRAVETRTASGRGAIHAVTSVVRAPSPEWRAMAPYGIVLVDLEEGVRLMAHAEPALSIGDAVEVGFLRIDDRVLPYARRAAPGAAQEPA